MKLTEQRRRFADEYIETGNIFRSAINAGYSESYAKTDACKILDNPSVKAYIDKRLESLKKKSIAEQDEVLQYLTSIMRGEQKEQTLKGLGYGEQEIDDIEVSAKDRVKAAELIGKRYGMWTDRTDLNVTLPQFIEDVPDDD